MKTATCTTAHNCTNPPHFPPHCGCPANVALSEDGES